ncbi:MAG TPA: amidohydrolase family protein [Acidimicrobiia bacterium]|nr:amidohydrolase family protein [Acidimicrobiia bacterium]
MSKPVVIVSCDEHTGPPAEEYRPYIEQRFHPRFDEWQAAVEGPGRQLWEFAHVAPERFDVADNEDALASGGLMGAWQPERRLQEMDREGVAFGLTNINANDTQRFSMPPFPGMSADGSPWTAEEMMAGARAHNRWLADFRDATDGRVHGSGLPGPFADMDATIAELEWLAEHGFHVITIPPPPLDDRYERFWAACADLGLVVNAHAGHSGAPAPDELTDLRPVVSAEQIEATLEKARELASARGQDPAGMTSHELLMQLVAHQVDGIAELSQSDRDVLSVEIPGMAGLDLTVSDRGPLWQLMLTGVVDRYPTLKVTFGEIRSDWVPGTLAYLDRRIPELNPSLALKPSEYWGRNFNVAASFMRPLEVQMREAIGTGQMMFSRDYPHPEGTWPNTIEWIREAFTGVPEPDARAILGENAIDWYGFDRGDVERIAERIGPRPEDLFGDWSVSAAKLSYFGSSSGFYKPRVEVNPEAIEYEMMHRPAGVYVPYTDFGTMVEDATARQAETV